MAKFVSFFFFLKFYKHRKEFICKKKKKKELNFFFFRRTYDIKIFFTKFNRQQNQLAKLTSKKVVDFLRYLVEAAQTNNI